MLDVAVIGAGAAGLGTAKAAFSRGLSCKVLEAASIPGGRARTDTTSLGMPFDIGCRSLYGGSSNPFLAFARETGSRLGPAPDNLLFHNGNRFLDASETEELERDFEHFEQQLMSAHTDLISSSSITDRSQADVIDHDNPSSEYFLQSMHLEFTAGASEVSLADPMHLVVETEGEEVLDGYGSLIIRAGAGAQVTFDCPVSEIDLSGRNVALDTPCGRVDARAVVVTVSTAVLAAQRITMLPHGWPEEKMSAIEAVPMGSVTKVGFRLKTGALPPEFTHVQGNAVSGSYIHCLMEEPKNATWLLGTGGGELAICYLGGVFSRELALAGEEAQVDWALQHLSGLLGEKIRDGVAGSCATPFDREPWIDGGYSYCRYGSGNQRPALADTIDNRVFFAGEACSLDHPGTAHGAWLSGEIAIDRITSSMGD